MSVRQLYGCLMDSFCLAGNFLIYVFMSHKGSSGKDSFDYSGGMDMTEIVVLSQVLEWSAL